MRRPCGDHGACDPPGGRADREALIEHASVTDLLFASQRGIGRGLLSAAKQRVAAAGFRRLTVGVLAGNAATAAMYQRLGFTPHAIELLKPIGPG